MESLPESLQLLCCSMWVRSVPHSKRAAGNRIGDELDPAGALPAGRQDNSTTAYIGVQWISGQNIKPAANRSGKKHLSLRGYLGLHGKTILPRLKAREGKLALVRFSLFHRQNQDDWKIGAGDRDRTGDIQLGKLAFYR